MVASDLGWVAKGIVDTHDRRPAGGGGDRGGGHRQHVLLHGGGFRRGDAAGPRQRGGAGVRGGSARRWPPRFGPGGLYLVVPPAPRAPKNSANGFPTSRQDNDLDSRIRDSRLGILSDSRSRVPSTRVRSGRRSVARCSAGSRPADWTCQRGRRGGGCPCLVSLTSGGAPGRPGLSQTLAKHPDPRRKPGGSGEPGCKTSFVIPRSDRAFLLFVVSNRRKGLTGRFFRCLVSRSSSRRQDARSWRIVSAWVGIQNSSVPLTRRLNCLIRDSTNPELVGSPSRRERGSSVNHVAKLGRIVGPTLGEWHGVIVLELGERGPLEKSARRPTDPDR